MTASSPQRSELNAQHNSLLKVRAEARRLTLLGLGLSLVMLMTLQTACQLSQNSPQNPAHADSTSDIAPLVLPLISEQTLSNGLSLISVSRPELPLVSVRLVIPSGSVRDPKGKEGLSSFTAQLLRRGSSTHTADEIDDAVEQIGGLLGVETGYQATSLSLTVPSEQVEAALEILAELVQHASFPEDEVERARRRELAQLQNDLDDPSTVAGRALARFFYGDEHPYSAPTGGSSESVKTFIREDLVSFRDTSYTPVGAFVVLVGDIKGQKARELVQKHLGNWEGKALEPIEVPWPKAGQGVELLLVDKPDASQAQIRVAVPGLNRHDPRFHAAVVANSVVGGGFTSRLVDEVRVNRGLSYSVGTRVVAMRDIGLIAYSTFTRSETVREILDVSFEVLDRFGAEGPSQDEVEKVGRYIVGLYPGRLESIEGLAATLASTKLLGLPFSSITSYRDEIAAVTQGDAAEVSQLWPSSQQARIVVVGKAKEIVAQLEGLGTIQHAKASDYR